MADNGTGHVVVFSTAPDGGEAERIGRAVVEEGLAACCNVVGGVKSIYTWKGELNTENEVLSIYKTRRELFEPLRKRIKELHGYEVPEIIAIDITAGLKEYLGWIDDVTSA